MLIFLYTYLFLVYFLQTTLLQYWEKTAHVMSGIHEAFKGYVHYQFTTLKVCVCICLSENKRMILSTSYVMNVRLQELRDPLDQIASGQPAEDSKEEDNNKHADKWGFLLEAVTFAFCFKISHSAMSFIHCNPSLLLSAMFRQKVFLKALISDLWVYPCTLVLLQTPPVNRKDRFEFHCHFLFGYLWEIRSILFLQYTVIRPTPFPSKTSLKVPVK